MNGYSLSNPKIYNWKLLCELYAIRKGIMSKQKYRVSVIINYFEKTPGPKNFYWRVSLNKTTINIFKYLKFYKFFNLFIIYINFLENYKFYK